jgi:hypothetical protein
VVGRLVNCRLAEALAVCVEIKTGDDLVVPG